MPRAVGNHFNRTHQKPIQSKGNAGDRTVVHNPIFNTERFGQHILKNPQVAQDIVDKVHLKFFVWLRSHSDPIPHQGNLKPSDKVFEIGPGTGNLTVRILEAANHVTVIEMDARMAAELTKRVQGKPEQKRLHIIIGDFVKAELPYFDVCISNTPYQISSHVIFRLLSHRPIFRVAILMFQQEFARRLVARPGSTLWSRLSANVQLYAKVDHIRDVGKNNFRPPPQVESSVIRMVPLNPPPPVRFEEFDGLTRIIFSRRNKTVRGNFQAKGVIKMLEQNWRTWCAENDKIIEDTVDMQAKVDAILEETETTETRAAKMDVDDILKLLSAFHDAGIHFG